MFESNTTERRGSQIMKLKSVLKNSKDLKKNGYKIIRKLHKLETKKGVKKAYKASHNDTYMFVLYCRGLTDLIEREYGEVDEFVFLFREKSKKFMQYLLSVSKSKGKINKSYLAGFLKSYTKFFNKIIDKRYPFFVNQEIIEKWNIECLMAYLATWGV